MTMGCFLACFGFNKKRKRRKSSSQIISEDHNYGRYVPLDSDVSIKLDIEEMPKASATKLSDKPKEPLSGKMKKKVRFNLNVKTYEPLPKYDEIDSYLSEGDEKTIWQYNQEERTGTSMTSLQFEEDSIASKIGSYPTNHRYQNCTNSYDEDDEIELEESDPDDDDDDDLDWDEEDDGGTDGYDNQQLNSASIEPEGLVKTSQLIEERKSNLVQLQGSQHQELKGIETNQKARNRSQYISSVLNPVENLTQWKTVKAKTRQQLKDQKENISMSQQEQQAPSAMKKNSHALTSKTLPNSNISKPMTGGMAVDASLSNWLV